MTNELPMKIMGYWFLLMLIALTAFLVQEILRDPNFIFTQGMQIMVLMFGMLLVAFASMSNRLLFIRDLVIGGIITEEEKKQIQPFEIAAIFWFRCLMVFLIGMEAQFLLSLKFPMLGILTPILAIVIVIIYFNLLDRLINALMPKSRVAAKSAMGYAIAFLSILLLVFLLDYFKGLW